MPLPLLLLLSTRNMLGNLFIMRHSLLTEQLFVLFSKACLFTIFPFSVLHKLLFYKYLQCQDTEIGLKKWRFLGIQKNVFDFGIILTFQKGEANSDLQKMGHMSKHCIFSCYLIQLPKKWLSQIKFLNNRNNFAFYFLFLFTMTASSSLCA